MRYRTLDHEALADLRLERLRTLEIEHARNALRLEDARSDEERAGIIDVMGDLERRHAVHLAFAEPADEPEPADDEPEPTADVVEGSTC